MLRQKAPITKTSHMTIASHFPIPTSTVQQKSFTAVWLPSPEAWIEPSRERFARVGCNKIKDQIQNWNYITPSHPPPCQQHVRCEVRLPPEGCCFYLFTRHPTPPGLLVFSATCSDHFTFFGNPFFRFAFCARYLSQDHSQSGFPPPPKPFFSSPKF